MGWTSPGQLSPGCEQSGDGDGQSKMRYPEEEETVMSRHQVALP